ncbi:MAG: hypothetical protein ACLP0B_02015, partial [Steroidobacteraceae bacterium]
MSSIICNRSGVIEVSPYSNKPASPRRPRKDTLNSNAAPIAAPYGEAVQSNDRFMITFDIEKAAQLIRARDENMVI